MDSKPCFSTCWCPKSFACERLFSELEQNDFRCGFDTLNQFQIFILPLFRRWLIIWKLTLSIWNGKCWRRSTSRTSCTEWNNLHSKFTQLTYSMFRWEAFLSHFRRYELAKMQSIVKKARPHIYQQAGSNTPFWRDWSQWLHRSVLSLRNRTPGQLLQCSFRVAAMGVSAEELPPVLPVLAATAESRIQEVACSSQRGRQIHVTSHAHRARVLLWTCLSQHQLSALVSYSETFPVHQAQHTRGLAVVWQPMVFESEIGLETRSPISGVSCFTSAVSLTSGLTSWCDFYCTRCHGSILEEGNRGKWSKLPKTLACDFQMASPFRKNQIVQNCLDARIVSCLPHLCTELSVSSKHIKSLNGLSSLQLKRSVSGFLAQRRVSVKWIFWTCTLFSLELVEFWLVFRRSFFAFEITTFFITIAESSLFIFDKTQLLRKNVDALGLSTESCTFFHHHCNQTVSWTFWTGHGRNDTDTMTLDSSVDLQWTVQIRSGQRVTEIQEVALRSALVVVTTKITTTFWLWQQRVWRRKIQKKYCEFFDGAWRRQSHIVEQTQTCVGRAYFHVVASQRYHWKIKSHETVFQEGSKFYRLPS